MAELADALDLGSSGATHRSSILLTPTKIIFGWGNNDAQNTKKRNKYKHKFFAMSLRGKNRV